MMGFSAFIHSWMLVMLFTGITIGPKVPKVPDEIPKDKDTETDTDIQKILSVEFLQDTVLGGLRALDSSVVPVNDLNETLNINIDAKLLSLTSFNEINGEVNFVMSMKLTWNAKNTPTWDPEAMSYKQSVLVSGNIIWKPKLLLLNPSHEVKDLTHLMDSVRLSNRGKVEWDVISHIEASCTVDITRFPFDSQTCNIDIASWGYSANEINIDGNITNDGEVYHSSSVWELLDFSMATGTRDDISFITYSLHFKRHWEYFTINILLPPVLLSFLSPCVFLLPARSGERISFAITSFLAFGVFSTLLADNIPRSSSPIALLCYFMMYMTLQSFGVVFCTIISLRIYGISEDKKVPLCVQAIVKMFRPSSTTCKKRKTNNTTANTDVDIEDGMICVTSAEGNIKSSSIEQATDELSPEKANITWKHVGHILDVFFFVTFIVLIIVSIWSTVETLAI